MNAERLMIVIYNAIILLQEHTGATEFEIFAELGMNDKEIQEYYEFIDGEYSYDEEDLDMQDDGNIE
jgi:hypothetical protein